MSTVADLALQPLAPYETGNWVFSDPVAYGTSQDTADIGYYIHNDRLYLQGLISNLLSTESTFAFQTVTADILTGLPPELCPAADTPLTLLATVTPFTATPGAEPDITFPATITTAGALALDALPPWINTPPDPTVFWYYQGGDPGTGQTPDFTNPLQYLILLGNVSWQLPADAEADTPTWQSLAPFLAGGDCADVDSQYAVHGTRVHLRGRVTFTSPPATSLTLSPAAPAETLAAVQSVALTDVGHRDGRPTLRAFNSGAHVFIDYYGQRVPMSGPAPAVPPFFYFEGPSAFGMLFLVAGLTNHAPDMRPDFSARIQASRLVNNGVGSLIISGVGNYLCHGVGADGFLPGSVTASINFDDICTGFYPAPDYFIVSTEAFIEDLTNANTGCPPVPSTSAFTLQQLASFNSRYAAGSTATPTHDGPAPWTTGAVGDPIVGSGGGALNWSDSPINIWEDNICVLARPTGSPSGYTSDPYNIAATDFLWTPAELAGQTISCSLAGPHATSNAQYIVTAVPLWKTRKQWFATGDQVNLDGAGWQAPESLPTPPPPPAIAFGEIRIAGSPGGIQTRRVAYQ